MSCFLIIVNDSFVKITDLLSIGLISYLIHSLY